ncbi:MAG TPA: M56 family metallopeptidase [Actinomycetota bacterium]
MVILAVSLVTLPAALALRRLIARPGGLASGVFLSLPLVVPLVAALAFEHAVLPEISLLKPAGTSWFGRSGDLLHLLFVSDDTSRRVIPYALVGSAGPWLLLIGLGVSSFMLLRRGIGAILVHRLVGRCAPLADARVDRMVARLALDAGLPHPPKVLVLPEHMSGAFAVGARRRGRILISKDLVDELDADELEGILAHEIAHLHAHDVHVVFTAGLLRDMVAWNPFAHVAYRRLTADRELEADRRAAAITGRPLAVASGLLKVCEMNRRGPRLKQRLALGFLTPGGRVARRVKRLIDLSDRRGAVALGSMGTVPYVAAACVVAVLGLQAGARMAELGGSGAVAIMWGSPSAPTTDTRTWTPQQASVTPRWIKRFHGRHPKAIKPLDDRIARLREDPAVLRRADVSRYVNYLQRMTQEARVAGIPTLIVRKQGWAAEPIVQGPLPFRILSLEEAPL